jgi:hypothetical protein
MRVHANQVHDQKRIASDELCRPVRLQTWFRDGKERYWVVDEARQVEQERQARRAAVQDVGEDGDDDDSGRGRQDVGENSDDDSGSGSGSGSQDDDSGDDTDGYDRDDIMQEIENWKAEAQERRLQALKDVPAVEMDSWL